MPSVTAALEAISTDLAEFERRLRETVAEDLGPMADAMEHIVRAGGKRLRPALCILSAKLGEPRPEHVHALAMGIEFIHTATLVHDDLIDDAETRRGLATIHALLGANPAIIVGDYYFAKGANLTASIGIPEIDVVISRTVMRICKGELLQLVSKRSYQRSLDDYVATIERKTAALLAACCYCGGLIARLDEAQCKRLYDFGIHLGVAFQIADDLLDYVATEAELGKPVGADLRQGTVTLPLMYALEDDRVGPELRALLARDQALEEHEYGLIVELVRRSSGVERAEQQARHHADAARLDLAAFPPSAACESLLSLCDYVVTRRV